LRSHQELAIRDAHTSVTFRTNDLRKAVPMLCALRQAINVSRYDLTGDTQCS
jgi:hypothetical protein